MSRRGSEKRRLTGQVLVRLTEAQQHAVAAHARTAQVTGASWLRLLIADAVSVDPGPRTTRATPPELILEIAKLREVLAEIGGALVQAAIACRQDGRPVEYDKIERLIPSVKAAVLDVDKVKVQLWPPAA
jgi:hypothetical protein